MDLKDIKAIIDLMKKNDLAEFQMEKEGFKIRIKRGGDSTYVPTMVRTADGPVPQPLPAGTAPSPTTASVPPTQAPPAASENVTEIVSPMVGTFYRSASPDTASFVEAGQPVDKETVVCIIEAMKVMNEIKAEVKGTVIEVLAENAKPVEFGQPLFKVKTG